MTKQELKALPLEERKEFILNMLAKKTHNFSMFSKIGGRKCKAFIRKCIKKVMNKKAIRKEDFEEFVTTEIKKVGNNGYEEIGDTAVREVVYYWLELAIEMADYDWNYFEYDY